MAEDEYTATDKEVERNITKDNREYVDSLAKKVEGDAGKGNMKDMYILTRKLSGKFQ
jgi:hypothetical protein